jgi:serine/threonine protein kinase
LHAQQLFHGNLSLDNIIFSSSKRENEIFLINPKFSDDNYELLREKIIRRAENYNVAPEILEYRAITSSSDLFSLGACIFFIVFGRYPYKSIQVKES